MKLIFVIILLPFILQSSFAQKIDSSILIQNTKITNIEKEDIVEINKVRKIIIQNTVTNANNRKSKLYELLKSDLGKKLSDYYLEEDRLNNEVKQRLSKIAVNNFLVEFINKAKNRNNINEFSESYSFLVTFPFYYDYPHGYGYVSSSFLIKMERPIKIEENGNENIGKFKMYPYKMIQIN